MSCSFYAHTVLGVKIDPSKLITTRRVKAFEHDYPEDWKVDPKDGRPLWLDEVVPIDGIVGWYEGESLELNLSDGIYLHGYEIVSGQDGEEYIALLHSVAYSDGGESTTAFIPFAVKDLDLSRLIYQAVETLVPLGLWDPETFGLHTFMVVSC